MMEYWGLAEISKRLEPSNEEFTSSQALSFASHREPNVSENVDRRLSSTCVCILQLELERLCTGLGSQQLLGLKPFDLIFVLCYYIQ